MAGLYPDVPDHRMPYDKDGTVGIKVVSGVGTVLTAGDLITLNDESTDSYAIPSGQYLALIFPELRDIYGFYWQATQGNTTHQGQTLQTSVDTTNGINGTWVTFQTDATWRTSNSAITPTYRSTITTATPITSVIAVRIFQTATAGTTGMSVVHLYGHISTGQNPDRLALWHPTLDQLVGAAYFDWGSALRGTTADRTFRVKNLSATLSANTVTCSTDALTDTSPTVLSQHTLSADATTFAVTASAGTLAPGAISGVMTLRRTISSTATLSLWALRVNAAAASWS